MQWRDRLVKALRSIGANDAANTEERRLERQMSQQGASATRKRGAMVVETAEQAQGGGAPADGPVGGPKRVKTEDGESKPDVKPVVGGATRSIGERMHKFKDRV